MEKVTFFEALDLGWDSVALMLFAGVPRGPQRPSSEATGRFSEDRGASLDSDLAAQARALRAAVEGGHRELAKRLVGRAGLLKLRMKGRDMDMFHTSSYKSVHSRKFLTDN